MRLTCWVPFNYPEWRVFSAYCYYSDIEVGAVVAPVSAAVVFVADACSRVKTKVHFGGITTVSGGSLGSQVDEERS